MSSHVQGAVAAQVDFCGVREALDLRLKREKKEDELDTTKPEGTDEGLDHGVGHFRPLSITRHRHLFLHMGVAEVPLCN